MQIRPARPDDVDLILAFIKELAAFEREPDAVHLTADRLAVHLFGPDPGIFVHMAEVDGEAAGMTLWFLNYSTWVGAHGIYVEELYVRPAFRGQGIGRALLQTLAGICVERDYGRLELSVLDWNRSAWDFYATLGGRAMDDWTVHRFTGGALRQLAQ